ncbi:MAG: hypothetical protein RL757_1850 [Bacteroidota bacterium]
MNIGYDLFLTTVTNRERKSGQWIGRFANVLRRSARRSGARIAPNCPI